MPPSDPIFRLPNNSEHIAVIGRNGSGKTQFATWVLSNLDYDKRPWLIVNFKEEDIFEDIPGSRPMDITGKIPTQSGVYIISAIIGDKNDLELLNDFFHRVWLHRDVGVLVDEGYVATGLRWFRACLTQGRSRHVTLMVLAQRPVFMDRFVWSEASRFAAFDLNMQDDKLTTGKMVPGYSKVELDVLPPYHCVWHDVKTNQTMILTPAPDRGTILDSFRAKARLRHKAL